MAEATVCVLLLFCSLFSGLVYYFNTLFEHGGKIKIKERPNFIVILADDIGWGDLWINEFDNTTPWLNMLKLEGKRYNADKITMIIFTIESYRYRVLVMEQIRNIT